MDWFSGRFGVHFGVKKLFKNGRKSMLKISCILRPGSDWFWLVLGGSGWFWVGLWGRMFGVLWHPVAACGSLWQLSQTEIHPLKKRKHDDSMMA